MPSTVIVAARQAAVAGLTDAFDVVDGPTVTYAWDPESSDAQQIFTMRPRGDQQPASMKAGRTFRNEHGRFQVVVHVELPGGSPEEADEKAIEHGVTVEEWFADNRHPVVEGLNWWVVESWEMSGGPTGQSSIAQLIYTIRYDARLT